MVKDGYFWGFINGFPSINDSWQYIRRHYYLKLTKH